MSDVWGQLQDLARPGRPLGAGSRYATVATRGCSRCSGGGRWPSAGGCTRSCWPNGPTGSPTGAAIGRRSCSPGRRASAIRPGRRR